MTDVVQNPKKNQFQAFEHLVFTKGSKFILVGLLLLAWRLRLHDLGGEPLWIDEVARLSLANRNAWIESHMFVGTTFVVKLASLIGDLPFIIRFPMTLASVASIPILFQFGNRFFGRGVGLLAAILLTVSPWSVFYAQDASPYALMFLWVSVGVWVFWSCLGRATPRRTQTNWLILLGIITASTLTHGFTILFWISLFFLLTVLIIVPDNPLLFGTTSRGLKEARLWWMAGTVLGVIMIALGALLLTQIGGGLSFGQGADTVLSRRTVEPQWPGFSLRYLYDLFSFFNGEPHLFDLTLPLFVIGLFGLGWRRVGLGLFVFGIPLAIMTYVGVLTEGFFLYNNRYMAFLIPLYLLLIASGIFALMRLAGRLHPALKWGVGVVLVGILVAFNRAGVSNVYADPGPLDFVGPCDLIRAYWQEGDTLAIIDLHDSGNRFRRYCDLSVDPIFLKDAPSTDAFLSSLNEFEAEASLGQSHVWVYGAHSAIELAGFNSGITQRAFAEKFTTVPFNQVDLLVGEVDGDQPSPQFRQKLFAKTVGLTPYTQENAVALAQSAWDAGDTVSSRDAATVALEMYRNRGFLYRALNVATPEETALYVEALKISGTLSFREGDYDRAEKFLREAVALAPDDHEALALLPEALLPQGAEFTVEAAQIEADAAALKSEVAQQNMVDGQEAVARLEYTDAYFLFKEAAELEPTSAEILTHLANIERRFGNNFAAYEILLEVTETHPDYAPAAQALEELYKEAESQSEGQ